MIRHPETGFFHVPCMPFLSYYYTTLIFNSQGIQYICNYGLACKNTNLFVRLEEILNNNFPELKKHDTYFMVNTRRIKRFLTLEENKIKNNDMINIFLIDA